MNTACDCQEPKTPDQKNHRGCINCLPLPVDGVSATSSYKNELWEAIESQIRAYSDLSPDQARELYAAYVKRGLDRDQWKRHFDAREEQYQYMVAELHRSESELAVAKERFGPAGYKIITEVAELRNKVASLQETVKEIDAERHSLEDEIRRMKSIIDSAPESVSSCFANLID
jgi:chromosome segregation ATPase